MTIAPAGLIQNTKNISPLKGRITETIAPPDSGSKQDFKDAFLSLIENTENTEAITREDAYKLSIGEADDLHTMMINSAKADIALQTMVQIRNKLLEAYSEVMRINL